MHVLETRRPDGHGQHDDERDRGEPRKKSGKDEQPADELRRADEAGQEPGGRQAEVGEVASHLFDVLELPPARARESEAERNAREEGWKPACPPSQRVRRALPAAQETRTVVDLR